jgi:hypothetical protein
MYAKQTESGFHITILPVLFPNTSFPANGPDAQWLAESGVYLVEEHLYFDANEFKRVGIEPTLRDNIVYTAELVALTDAEKIEREAEKTAQMASVAREQRNHLLTQSDWSQLADATGDKSAWAAYRQALRDVPGQNGFPQTIEWPNKPGSAI